MGRDAGACFSTTEVVKRSSLTPTPPTKTDRDISFTPCNKNAEIVLVRDDAVHCVVVKQLKGGNIEFFEPCIKQTS
jgi:hypothetical protein